MKTIKLKKGFDINLVGKPEKKIIEVDHSDIFAVKPTDFIHISRPKLLVKEGDNVLAGTPLFYEKMMEKVMYCAPVSGEIVEIKRGAKRKLLEIKILADKKVEHEQFTKYSLSEINNLSKEEVINHLVKHGVWPHFIQRPFGIVANPEDTPKAIFISGFDTHPLAPDYSFLLQNQQEHFKNGLSILTKLTEGKVHLNVNADDEFSKLFSNNVEGIAINKFSGKHPVGNVGVQIHHLQPINKGDIVWTLSAYGVTRIGILFSQGIYDASQLVALAGSEVKTPAYVKGYAGMNVNKICKKWVNEGKNRIISGNPLTGTSIGNEGFLGFYHHQITAIPEGDYEELFGWALPSSQKLSFHRAFGMLSFLNRKKEYLADTNQHGEQRNFVMTGAFEKVLPMDILPTHLFKAILCEDYEGMEQLGIYELIEEDVALCEYIDVSKNDIQEILREGIEMIRNS